MISVFQRAEWALVAMAVHLLVLALRAKILSRAVWPWNTSWRKGLSKIFTVEWSFLVGMKNSSNQRPQNRQGQAIAPRTMSSRSRWKRYMAMKLFRACFMESVNLTLEGVERFGFEQMYHMKDKGHILGRMMGWIYTKNQSKERQAV